MTKLRITHQLSALSLAAGLAVAPIAAFAQGAPGFAAVDLNIDGVISEDEFLAAMPSMTADDFVMADGNGDTVLTQEEYEAMTDAM
ncbi:MAG: hypothetical protein KI785_07710 [Devosiaceae bacterium]|nr:hypothetical protein [Devosiaceae bacterium MH13]